MIIVFAIVLVVAVLGLLGIPKSLSVPVEQPLSHDMTCAVNGFFILIVVMNHAQSYVPDQAFTWFDELYYSTISRMGQLMVTSFLLYSGFGVMESIRSKKDYVKQLPYKRVLPFILDVAIALVPFIIVRLFKRRYPTLNDVILALLGRVSFGNSNWYIFAIICMYMLSWVAFKVSRTEKQGLALMLIGTIVYISILWFDNPSLEEARWYDTVFCFPGGMLLSYVLSKTGRELSLRKRLIPIVVCGLAFLVAFVVKEPRALMFNLRSVAFALIVTLALMNVKLVGRPFVWLGRNLFYLFIYQRLFMILLKPISVFGLLPFLFCVMLVLIPWCFGAKMVHEAVRRAAFS